MRASISDALGIEIPIVQAPIQGPIGDPAALALPAAVCNAGGLGTVSLWRAETETVRARIRDLKRLTNKPFAVNLNLDFPQEERLEACIEEGVPAISFFWGDPSRLVGRAKEGGAIVLHTVGSASEAKAAVQCGVDIVVAQGWEAGGHVRGTVATLALVPAVVDAVAPVPVIAAGGIADGRGLAAVMALGASGGWIGTRFLASTEVAVHEHYGKGCSVPAKTTPSISSGLFDIGWPNAPHRALRNPTVTAWETAGRPPAGKRLGEGEVVATSKSRGPVVRYSAVPPMADVEGDPRGSPDVGRPKRRPSDEDPAGSGRWCGDLTVKRVRSSSGSRRWCAEQTVYCVTIHRVLQGRHRSGIKSGHIRGANNGRLWRISLKNRGSARGAYGSVA